VNAVVRGPMMDREGLGSGGKLTDEELLGMMSDYLG